MEARVVLEAITLKMKRSGRNFVTIAETAKQANISNTRARGQLKVLQARGLVVSSKIGHRNCFYLMDYTSAPVALCRKKKVLKVALKKIEPEFCLNRHALTAVIA